MSPENLAMFWPFVLAVGLLFLIGIYCVLFTYNLIRALIGLEILIKAVTLLIIVCGFLNGHEALMQGLVITVIVIEVVVVTVAVGVIIGIRSFNDSLDPRNIRNLKG